MSGRIDANSRSTSIKTRIETSFRGMTRRALQIPEAHSLKQGLKRSAPHLDFYINNIPEAHPLKQGLKH